VAIAAALGMAAWPPHAAVTIVTARIEVARHRPESRIRVAGSLARAIRISIAALLG
jgi:hypothetical protein